MTAETPQDSPRTPVLGHQCPFCGSWLPKDDETIQTHLMLFCEPVGLNARRLKRVNK